MAKNDNEVEAVAAVEPAQALMLDLMAVDAKARASGHSLVEILAVAAKNQFGLDVRPDPAPAEI